MSSPAPAARPVWPAYYNDPVTKGACCIALSTTTEPPEASAADAVISAGDPHYVTPPTHLQCAPNTPHVLLRCEDSATNSLPAAYHSNGYPSVTGQPNGTVYNAFADLNSMGTLDDDFDVDVALPPRHAMTPQRTDSVMSTTGAEMETLMHIEWNRAGNVFEGKAKTSTDPTPPNFTMLQTLPQYLKRFPEGIHSIQTSEHMERLVVRGDLPLEGDGIPSAHHICYPPSVHHHPPTTTAAAAKRPSVPKPAADTDKDAGETKEKPATPPAPAPAPPVHYIKAKPPRGSAPVQHTLTAVNTYTHLTVYFTAHQDSRVLLNTPVQTFSASIATKKITAQKLLLVGRHESVNRRCEGSPHSPGSSSSYVFESSHAVSVPRRDGSAGSLPYSARLASSLPRPAAVPAKRFVFVDVPLEDHEQAVFCAAAGSPSCGGGPKFRGVDGARRTISVAPCALTVSPMILVGNQSGDLLLIDILEQEIVLRLNYSAPAPEAKAPLHSAHDHSGPTASPSSTGGKVISAAVTCIAEVECGVEKYLSSLIQSAAAARRDGISTFDCFCATHKDPAQTSVSPSLYAVGFEDGQLLLVCIMSEGGWTLRHFPSTFGSHPIEDIAVRRYDFFMRLWVSYDAAEERSESNHRRTSAAGRPLESGPRYQHTSTITSDQMLNISERSIAAIACNGGTIKLVQLPDMEVLYILSVLDFNAVGYLHSLRWVPSQREALLAPDLLLAAGEDDTITSFCLVTTPHSATAAPLVPPPVPPSPKPRPTGISASVPVPVRPRVGSYASGGPGTLSGSRGGASYGSVGSPLPPWAATPTPERATTAGVALRVLEKKAFHRSWVTSMGLMPLVVPQERSGGGMPKYHGVVVMATSYDGSQSFWPHIFPSNPLAAVARRESSQGQFDGPGSATGRSIGRPSGSPTRPPGADSVGFGGPSGSPMRLYLPAPDKRNSGLPQSESMGSFCSVSGGRVGDGRLLLIHGPSSVYRMHSDLVVRASCSGAGTSFFMTTVCCRGKVKCWSLNLREEVQN